MPREHPRTEVRRRLASRRPPRAVRGAAVRAFVRSRSFLGVCASVCGVAPFACLGSCASVRVRPFARLAACIVSNVSVASAGRQSSKLCFAMCTRRSTRSVAERWRSLGRVASRRVASRSLSFLPSQIPRPRGQGRALEGDALRLRGARREAQGHQLRARPPQGAGRDRRRGRLKSGPGQGTGRDRRRGRLKSAPRGPRGGVTHERGGGDRDRDRAATAD